jgi:hypothetical protein
MIAAASIAQGQTLQFDLVCIGTTTWSFPITHQRPITAAIRERLRVDLKRRVWRQDDCRQVYNVASADAKEVRFETAAPPDGTESNTKFDYGSGVFSDRATFGPGNPVLTKVERCDVVPSSGQIP